MTWIEELFYWMMWVGTAMVIVGIGMVMEHWWRGRR